MKKGGTTSSENTVPGWFIAFQIAVLQQLPRPGNGLSRDQALFFSRHQQELKIQLQRVFANELACCPFFVFREWDLLVPLSYSHEDHLETLRGLAVTHNTSLFEGGVLDPINRCHDVPLVPGKRYRITVYRVASWVTPHDCMEFLNDQGAVLAGLRGASLVKQYLADGLSEIQSALSETDRTSERNATFASFSSHGLSKSMCECGESAAILKTWACRSDIGFFLKPFWGNNISCDALFLLAFTEV